MRTVVVERGETDWLINSSLLNQVLYNGSQVDQSLSTNELGIVAFVEMRIDMTNCELKSITTRCGSWHCIYFLLVSSWRCTETPHFLLFVPCSPLNEVFYSADRIPNVAALIVGLFFNSFWICFGQTRNLQTSDTSICCCYKTDDLVIFTFTLLFLCTIYW